MKSLSLHESSYVLQEIHEGINGLHTGSRALIARETQAKLYLPTILQDVMSPVKRYDKCQVFALVPR